MTSREIRKQFLEFFEKKNHRIVQSAPVVPFDDPTLLFTNAGMNQFKDVFLGKGTRDYKRAADTQKCIRVSGKHNDLEEVGYDTYHHTFFEMLGNWSFGDYYKEEAIVWAWELLTEVWKLPKERIWATVYRTDDEALGIWKNKTDINPLHVLKFDEKDNFWEMGDTGPCGPCSEIHFNISDDYENPSLVNAGSPDCIEIWNLVFIQYNRDETGKLNELPAKHVDTGMGFERMVAVIQNKKSNYHTDVFSPLIDKISEITGIPQENENDLIAMRVIADHVRTLTFAIADGAAPGNEGRSYVLRRILRRAARYGRNLKMQEPFIYQLVDVLSERMGDVFPEIVSNRTNIKNIIKGEEESFNATLDRGLELFERISEKPDTVKNKTIPGEDVFLLYDTFGFPIDLTAVLAKEKNLDIDETGFENLMQVQKDRARQATKSKIAGAMSLAEGIDEFETKNLNPTEFLGYELFQSEAVILGIKRDNSFTHLITDKTPFYVESGGQVDDLGLVIVNGIQFEINDVYKIDKFTVHLIESTEINVALGQTVTLKIDEERRYHIMRNHSVTHFMHAALRSVLGEHVKQAGSYVGPDRLRFDFSHFEKVNNEQIAEIEKIVNYQLRKNLPLTHHRNIPFEDAKNLGALMFFGDKYGDKVNVVQFGNYTKEFCGGTHVKNSSEIGLFKIINESSISSGIRRIEALTGKGVEDFILLQEKEILERENKINELTEEKRKLEKTLNELQLKTKMGGLEDLINSSKNEKLGFTLVKGKIDVESMDDLKALGDELRNKIKSGIGVIFSNLGDKVGIVCVISDDLIKDKKLSAGKIVGDAAKLVGGGGGGRPHLATAGGKEIEKIDEALSAIDNIIEKYL